MLMSDPYLQEIEMGKLDDTNDEVRKDAAEGGPDATGDDDTEGHLMMPHDPGMARALASDRGRDVERRSRDREAEREARDYKQGRGNR
jgi:hypothetical protein